MQHTPLIFGLKLIFLQKKRMRLGKLFPNGFNKSHLRWKLIDTYIIKKFLFSFFFAISLLMTIIVVFDFSENIQRFLDNGLSIKLILTGYYLNFIPYFINLFIPLFAFISTIWFTSRLSNNNEIICILNGGISFYRMMLPYVVGAIIIAFLSILMSNTLVPKTNANLDAFKREYMGKRVIPSTSIHIRNSANSYIFVDRWNKELKQGYLFTYEELGLSSFKKRITAQNIHYDNEQHRWVLHNYRIRTIRAGEEIFATGEIMDTVFNIKPLDLNQDEHYSEQMTYRELVQYIRTEKERGTGLAKYYIIEKHRRLANAFGTLILTLLGLGVAAEKSRRGVGVHIFFGLALAFTFIFFQQISNVFSVSGSIPPGLGPWIPNIIFTFICFFILRNTTK